MITSMQQVTVLEVREGELEQKVSQFDEGPCALVQVVTGHWGGRSMWSIGVSGSTQVDRCRILGGKRCGCLGHFR